MGDRPLRIAYLCDRTPQDRNAYSGGNARMHDALTRHAGAVTVLSQGWGRLEPVRSAIARMPWSVQMRLRWRAHLALAGEIARGVSAELATGRYDAVFCAYSLWSLHRLEVPAETVLAFSSDTTQSVFQSSELGAHFNPRFRPTRVFDGWVERCERTALNRADLCFWPSVWQKTLADGRYGLSAERSILVPWGANIDAPPARQAPPPIGRDRPLRLLLIGRDWFAKGGPMAFDTMQALRASGVDARLTVIGCVPPEFHVNEWVTVHPSLDKAVPAELRQFNAAFAEAHFLIQPSLESYGFAFCEASAFGLPALCLRQGGVPVVEGRNGHALAPGSGPDAFAAAIQRYLDAPARYEDLSRSARREYEDRLNWDAWASRVTALMAQAAARKAR